MQGDHRHDQPANRSRRWRRGPTVAVAVPLTHDLIGTVQFESELVEGARIIREAECGDENRVVADGGGMAVAGLDRGDVVTPAAMVQAREAWLDRRLPTLFNCGIRM